MSPKPGEAGPQNSGPGEGGGTSSVLISEVRGTRGSLPEGTSQPDDPGGVGGLGPGYFVFYFCWVARIFWAA